MKKSGILNFKQLTAQSAAVVRSGEFTPYANVILVAGVVFQSHVR